MGALPIERYSVAVSQNNYLGKYCVNEHTSIAVIEEQDGHAFERGLLVLALTYVRLYCALSGTSAIFEAILHDGKHVTPTIVPILTITGPQAD